MVSAAAKDLEESRKGSVFGQNNPRTGKPNVGAAIAPAALVATAGSLQASIAFTQVAQIPGDNPITSYEFKVGAGAWTARQTGTTASPIVITGLTASVQVSIVLRAITASGKGAASAAVVLTPYTTPGAPTGLVATPGNTTASIAFTAPASDGGNAITDYEYKVDAGAWTTGATAATPVVITGLTNAVEVSVVLRGVNAAGGGTASAAVLVTPTA